MISLFGVTKSEQLRALIEICFNPNVEKMSYLLVDEAIQTDTLSGEQYRVLPFLYSKSDLNQFSEFTATKIKSAHKHTLYRNHLLLHRAIKFQEMLYKAGFTKSIFLKGVAHSLRSVSGIGSRPMVDIDILVKDLQNKPDKILNLLEQHHFKILDTSSRSLTALSPEGYEFDIHWYLSEWALSAELVDKLFKYADRIVFRGHTFLVPCIEHHFMHVLGHGVLNPSLTFDARWAIDVLTILTENKHLNSDRLVDFANQFNAKSTLKEALQLLANETPQSIAVDRKLCILTANQIKKESYVVRWLFNEQPRTNDINAYTKSRRTWLKIVLRNHVYVPLYVWLFNNVPLSNAIGLSLSFPPLPIFQSFKTLFRKVLQKFPRFLFNSHSKIRRDEP
jgi:hypothetical protein